MYHISISALKVISYPRNIQVPSQLKICCSFPHLSLFCCSFTTCPWFVAPLTICHWFVAHSNTWPMICIPFYLLVVNKLHQYVWIPYPMDKPYFWSSAFPCIFSSNLWWTLTLCRRGCHINSNVHSTEDDLPTLHLNYTSFFVHTTKVMMAITYSVCNTRMWNAWSMFLIEKKIINGIFTLMK